MGRTKRWRKSKIKNEECTIDSPEIISLNKWIKTNGFKKYKRMRLSNFANTGRGVMALENINRDDILMEIPFNLILSLYTLQMDEDFKSLFNVPGHINETQSCQAIISFYLAYLKICKSSYWSYYLETIPDNFNVPYFVSNESSMCLDSSIKNIVEIQKSKVINAFNYFKNLLCLNLHINNSFFILFSSFTIELYSWAYFAVNSRCVYLDPCIINNVFESNGITQLSFVNLIDDSPNLGLIPYLDMFNHSSDAKTDAILTYSKNFKSCSRTAKDLPIFRLATLSSFRKYDQIFISYGQHSNLKLLTEYGFCLPLNPYSCIKFDFEDICEFIKSLDYLSILSKEKYNYILKHNMNKDIYIDKSGLSYSFLRLLFIISDHDKSTWDTKIYSAFSNTDLFKIFKIVKPFLYQRRKMYLNITSNFSPILKSMIVDLCLNLVEDYVTIIDSVLLSIE